ncbi:hypothetical protein HBH64_085480 [Parastagonospora nodorum]|nr:hypothetical protein HBH53_040680 [Parastagonospora nodorum]KAH4296366.1 hypothetical protein HBI01_146990 [Parastagonospora nodorum]KAH4304781.1 hypothetical protein HBI02_127830 [Parastagonospora nodorum]KAH4338881.1 hypothetical protein HBI00_010650 [Parastagonospora nodorum]KAH4368000.1 hypothetical protein HBH94_140800 [Parastagonospora nodorum]
MTNIAGALHVYEPLDGADHIRLMCLEPAFFSQEPLRFSFLSGNLIDFEDRYEAVSYTWGEPLLTYPLHHKDGTQVMVTANLDRALRRYRLPVTKRLLWADAVCINQEDDTEKAAQIPLMVQIFRNASKVQAWVGGGAQEERGMQYLSKLSRFSSLPLKQLSTELHSVAQQFLGLPWFNRLWVIQEVVFNNDVILTCCDSELSWSRLVSALQNTSRGGSAFPAFISPERRFALNQIARLWKHHCLIQGQIGFSITSLKPMVAEKIPQDILDVVNVFTEYGCSDARDRIYALYSMTSGVSPTNASRTSGVLRSGRNNVLMDIDYSLDVRDTYRTFALACIIGGRLLQVLNNVLSRCPQYTEDWPTWVPDWRQPNKAIYVPIVATCRDFDLDGRAMQKLLENSSGNMLQVTQLYPAGQLAYIHSLQISEKLSTEASDEALLRLLRTLSVQFTTMVLEELLRILLYAQWLGQLIRPPKNVVRQQLAAISDYLNNDASRRADELPQILLDAACSLRNTLKSFGFFTASPADTSQLWAEQVDLVSVGCGTSAMRPGDQLWPYKNTNMREVECYYGSLILILRPEYDASEVVPNRPIAHRLVGCGWVSNGYVRIKSDSITLVDKLQKRGSLGAWNQFEHTVRLV